MDAVVSATQKVPLPGIQASSNGSDSNSNQILQQTEMLATITKLLQQAQEVIHVALQLCFLLLVIFSTSVHLQVPT